MTDERAAFALFLPAFFACLSGFLFGLRWCANIRLATLPSASPVPAPTTAPIEGQEGQEGQEQPTITPSRTFRERITNERSPLWLILFYGGLSSIAVFFIYFGFAVRSAVYRAVMR